MLRRSTWFRMGALAALLLLISAGNAQAEFTPIAGWDHQLFPSFLVSTATLRPQPAASDTEESEDADDDSEQENANEEESSEEAAAEGAESQGTEVLGDRGGVLGVTVQSPGEDVAVTVTITSDSILEPSTFSGTLDEEGASYTIFPRIKFKYDHLMKNKQSVPVTVTFRVEVGDEEPEERTETLTLRSVNDCPFTIVHPDKTVTDVSFVFAAYVNEQHPFVDKILREALDAGVVDSFTGYQSKNPSVVLRQVYALWHALSVRDVRYSSITASAAESDVVHSQHVRLIDESINNAQANCVDGSVLLASLLRKINIEPALVFVPGHCYLAFYLDQKRTRLVGFETTMIGATVENAPNVEALKDVVGDDWHQQNSWGTFASALSIGTADLQKNAPKFDAKTDANFQLVSIAAARKLGILPIAFDSANSFESLKPAGE